MRQGVKITIPYQFFYIFMQHLAGCGVAFVLMMVFSWCFGVTPLKEIASVIFMLIYAIILYSGANELSIQDNKPYTPLKPQVFKSFLWGLAICVITFLTYILYNYSWSLYDAQNVTSFILTIFSNIVFSFWTYPYVGIIGASKGYVMMYSFIFWIIVPITSCMAGYVAGCRGFLLQEVIRKFVYRKDK